MEVLTRNAIEWHVESAPYPGESVSGDLGELIVHDQGAFAFAIDALGHGPDAAQIAARAAALVADHLPSARLEQIFERCHSGLRGTRGAAVCLARIDSAQGSLEWLSVGNIQAVHIKINGNGMPHFQSLVMRGGVVGDRMPELRACRAELNSGDMIVLASDGIEYGGWFGEFRPEMSPESLARVLLQRHRVISDDSMVLVARYTGAGDMQ